MLLSIPLTPTEQSHWESMRGMFFSSNGDINDDMLNAFSASVVRALPSADFILFTVKPRRLGRGCKADFL